MKRILCLAVAGMFTAMAASAASVPASLKSKVASDDQLASVRGGAPATIGGGVWQITMPSLTINRPATPVFQPNPPGFPQIAHTPIIVVNNGSITITLPTFTVTTTPPTITPPASPIVSFTLPSIVKLP